MNTSVLTNAMVKAPSKQWGDFRTCFKFQLGASGKIKRLDIGQAE